MSQPAAYDAIAAWYDAQLETGKLFHALILPAVFELIGPVEGHHICDLACGQGIVARQLAQQRALVVGVDISAALLALAHRYETGTQPAVTYRHGDAQTCRGVANASFDGVVCNMALMDIPALQATCRTVARILKPHGWFVFSIIHPCYELVMQRPRLVKDEPDGVSHEVWSYFVEGAWQSSNPEGVRGKVVAYHRTLSTYLNALVQAGLHVERVLEPQASGAFAVQRPDLQDVPAILAVRARRM
jgi:ubiquinone/menaquinone biosynthesis C-methylase UbiE